MPMDQTSSIEHAVAIEIIEPGTEKVGCLSFQFATFSDDFLAIPHGPMACRPAQGGMDEDDLTWMVGGDKSPVGRLRRPGGDGWPWGGPSMDPQ